MEYKIQIQILNSLLELNNDRIIIYTMVRNEIIYHDLKKTLTSCIQKSLLFKEQLKDERNRLVSQAKVNYKAKPNQEFFNIWLEINECLSLQKHRRINSLFNASENIFESTYTNTLKEDNLKHLSLKHKNLILKQKELLKAS
ncbi:hypothetical protein [Planktosalinus lacus]|uniref:DUF2383 domain-containing protein n=1 Tax=Planktosalinus lacus TaxID=1526573 RepID=A0A8J2YBX0_9FLAO|nr:hypothetical protein [Planktosalinus lacus]GGE01448.1 hypothetical protein GCM10011312_26140 [Planktosalinus lacus]